MWEGHSAWHVELPQRGIEPTSLPAVEMRVLTTGTPGESNSIHFMLNINYASALGFCQPLDDRSEGMGNNKTVVEIVDGGIKLDNKGSEAIDFWKSLDCFEFTRSPPVMDS